MIVADNAARAKAAALAMAASSSEQRNQALRIMGDELQTERDRVFQANRDDMQRARDQGVGQALLHRLRFDEHKLEVLRSGLESLIALPDPVGELRLARELDEGLDLYRVTCPIGVIGVVFEARPDALVQIAALCLKSGNAVILKGGSEAAASNRALFEALQKAGRKARLPEGWLTLISSREDVKTLLQLDQYIDLLIPRGSNEFVQYIMAHTKIPVLGHADGVCHTYIAADCDQEMAIRVTVDAKTQYVAVCNATETVLLDSALLENEFAERLLEKLAEKHCLFYGDERLRSRLGTRFAIEKVDTWHHEYLDYALSIKIVDGVDEAIEHINRYGSGHTEAILTTSAQKARQFMTRVDAGNVFWNCSTRFSDGFRYGFGAEVGVSTAKIHARGPVGLEGLLTYKYMLFGHGQRVADYEDGSRRFTHKVPPAALATALPFDAEDLKKC